VVTLAAVMADRIADGGVARDRIEVVPNAVDVASFPVVTRDAGLAERHGIDPAATVIGYISSIAEYEGIDTLICAYAGIKAVADGPVALLIVGDGPGPRGPGTAGGRPGRRGRALHRRGAARRDPRPLQPDRHLRGAPPAG